MKKLLKGSELVLGVVHQEGDRPLAAAGREEGAARAADLRPRRGAGRAISCWPRRSAGRRGSRRGSTPILGDPFAPRSFSLIAIHKHGIPHEFPGRRARRRRSGWRSCDLGEREDLTHIPIVAIDPADARDHDDAVWAAPDDDPANAGGWKAIVAIADVSFYVRPGSALDKEARKRGNSVYFPDRVVPMLPETLSADVCSLKEGEDRAALVCHLQVDEGRPAQILALHPRPGPDRRQHRL